MVPADNTRKAIIFTGPSGGGKTTLSLHTLGHFDNVERSVSVTTRSPRAGEVHGKDYLFMDVKQFNQHIHDGDFVEWEQVYEGLYYGTLRSEIDRIWTAGKAVLFVVDVIGANTLKKYFGDQALMIYVRTPDMTVLETRLRTRGTENEDSIRKRLKRALGELTYEGYADKVIVNDQLDISLKEVQDIVESFLCY